MLDRVFAAISMLGLITFMGIVMWFVREPDLIIVSVVVIGIGVLFIWRDIKPGGDSDNGPGSDKAGG